MTSAPIVLKADPRLRLVQLAAFVLFLLLELAASDQVVRVLGVALFGFFALLTVASTIVCARLTA